MASDLTIRTADLQAVLSSTACVALRRISLGTVRHPGQPVRKYLAGGLKLTVEQRADISALAQRVRSMAIAEPTREQREATLGLVGKMLMAYPMGGSSAEAGAARGEAYLVALDDVPPWATAEAIKRWHRGQFAGEHNYRFAPAPAELREGAMHLLQGAKQTIAHLEDVLAASSIEEAMDPNPRELAGLTMRMPKLRAI